MTAVADLKTKLVSQLINSCYRAQEGYRSAAGAVDDNQLRRLFEIYAQQRTRFAEELREYLPIEQETTAADASTLKFAKDSLGTGRETIRKCLEIDSRTLALYKEALADRALPTRAHFLISSQLALMERVHDRMNVMLDEPATIGSRLQQQRVFA